MSFEPIGAAAKRVVANVEKTMVESKPISQDVYDELRKDRDYWRRKAKELELQQRIDADNRHARNHQEVESVRRQSWGDAINGRY